MNFFLLLDKHSIPYPEIQFCSLDNGRVQIDWLLKKSSFNAVDLGVRSYYPDVNDVLNGYLSAENLFTGTQFFQLHFFANGNEISSAWF